MTETLMLHRQFLDATTQSAAEVYRTDPFVTDSHSRLVVPAFVSMKVRDVGIWQFREGQTSKITMETQFDEYGRPLQECVVNEDAEVRSERNWYYEMGGLDYQDVIMVENAENEIVWSYRWFDVNIHQFVAPDGGKIGIRKTDIEDGSIVDVSGSSSARQVAIFDGDHKLVKAVTFGDKEITQNFFYNEHGQLVRVERRPGSLRFNGRNNPDVTEYEYEGSVVRIEGYSDTLNNHRETRVYDEKSRPISITSERGIIDIGRMAISMQITYDDQPNSAADSAATMSPEG